ncbi:hypothetical protein ABIB57_000911 [Devosia sp. UYZn731]|uniref:hypothetical protein n=1 Tax=Devosia sp. UYZn731 TaxID=3156345 RepID=UPI003390B760
MDEDHFAPGASPHAYARWGAERRRAEINDKFYETVFDGLVSPSNGKVELPTLQVWVSLPSQEY